MKDWLGQEYDVGDTVIYAAMSGRSVTMVLATVVKFNDSRSVTVQPERSSRWKQHHGRTRYIDNRTGRGIDPYAGWDEGRHVKEAGHYIRTDTCARVTDAEAWQLGYGMTRWVPVQFKDYVEEVTEAPKPVTLTVTQNITKWTGEVPDATELG